MDKQRNRAQCQICRLSFDVSVLLQSSNNDFYCKECFKRSFCSGSKALPSGDARTRIVDRNAMQFLPNPERFVQSSQITNILRGHQSISTMSLSRRPLQCPKADCNKYISVCTLESHFKHEHKQVPVVTTLLDARCASEFHPRDVRYCTIQCIVLLKVITSEFSNARRPSRMTVTSEEQNPIMVLMSTRIADIRHNIVDDGDTNDVSPERNGGEEEVFRKGDRIIVWLASNIQTNLSYTVAVSTLDNKIRQKFYGPMLTLNESSEKVNREGNCLILTHLHCTGMTENGAKPLALDVVVHSPE